MVKLIVCVWFSRTGFWRFVTIALGRENAEGLGINDMQIDCQYVYKPIL